MFLPPVASERALRLLQLTFLGNPFVIFTRMLYPILELAIVALWQSPRDRIDPAWGVHVARSWTVKHNLSDMKSVV
jgi:hypothetical protein